MKLFYGLVVMLAANAALAASPITIDFSTGQPADYFTEDTASSVSRFPIGGAQGMLVADATALLRDVTVLPSTKYRLTLLAAGAGDVEWLEDNPRFEFFHQPGQTSAHLPAREIEFFNAAGQPIGRPLAFALPYRQSHSYQDVFYTPDDAVTARIRLSSGKGIRLALTRLALEPAADEKTLNVNPSFDLGPDNYSGWKNIAAGGKFIQRDGKTILDTKYGSTGQTIPLPESGTYALSALATGNGYNSIVIVRVYDSEGQELMRSSTRRYGPRTYFVPPPEAAYASLLVYSCLLEEVRLVRVGDENMINEMDL
ncbi:hypothetical protein [Aureliella helgolandensis]|uniref:DUF4397 domain-containing protein n=1 Tax=Aureliella helgolandensis TaxID=2527968 RepID=A0A518GD36_9BACT|nr:hypothetical protein [Aureliella helgolandensis]QDV26493.1 hypothetical protein Q31a_48670 [Aureliella helgolandensis]